jgi:hypothetical protein
VTSAKPDHASGTRRASMRAMAPPVVCMCQPKCPKQPGSTLSWGLIACNPAPAVCFRRDRRSHR